MDWRILTRYVLCSLLIGTAGVCLSVGCAQDGKLAGVLPPGAGPAVTIEVEDGRVPFWQMAEATVRVENTLSRPIALLDVSLQTANGAVVQRGGAETLAAKATSDGAVVEGTLLVDDPGPMARPKFPDRWEWAGEATLVHFPVLLPGQSYAVTGSFRVTDKTGGRVLGAVRFVELTEGAVLLMRAGRTLESLPMPAEGTFGKGWVPTRRMTVTFRRDSEFSLAPHAKPHLGQQLWPQQLPACWKQGLLEPAYLALAKKAATVQVERDIEIDAPALPLAEAREQAGVAEGPTTYFPARSAWVIEGADATHIVGADGKSAHPGRLVRLVERLTGGASVELTLFEDAASEDPDGLIAFLKGKGLKATSTLQKDQSYRGVIEVRSADLDAAVKTLAERGLRVDGLDVQ